MTCATTGLPRRMRARPQDRSVLSTRESASTPRERTARSVSAFLSSFLRPSGLLACASRRVCVSNRFISSCLEEGRAAAYVEEPPAKRVETNGVGWRCRRDGPSPCDGRTSRLSSSTGAPNQLSDDLKLCVRHQSDATETRQVKNNWAPPPSSLAEVKITPPQ